LVLTLVEREEISRAVVAGRSIRSLAAKLGRTDGSYDILIRQADAPPG
jgi:IS30 family transposase